MSKNLIKRILTSAVLIGLLIFFVFNNQYTWLFSLIIVSLLCWVEFINLFKKILKKNINLRDIFIALAFGYLSLFIICSLILYNLGFAVFALSVCIFSDIGGYVIGKIIGGKKLTKISPNKTVSGSVGSFIFSLIPFLILYLGFEQFINTKFLILIIFSLLISLVSQLGDLFISLLKRKAKVKDTGYFLPGHGGLLDRVDGIIFALPFTTILLFTL
tara:strand:+ start:2858 stop:3505 length:648 start_codon:yes stop_codon:yes gene_type:complete